mmetsp:Transcript_33135/g.84644  ORF Transcript_33135/g.84644 Transcript_33135/m.84644 type:complete len:233 (-) Transcript_33135:568-1266(-)
MSISSGGPSHDDGVLLRSHGRCPRDCDLAALDTDEVAAATARGGEEPPPLTPFTCGLACKGGLGRKGSRTENVDPLPCVLCTSTEPPWILHTSATMESPRPMPSYLRLSEESCCWNGSKMCESFAFITPMPVSSIAMVTVSALSSDVAKIFTWPSLVNLKAFCRRWYTICETPWWSPLMDGMLEISCLTSTASLTSGFPRLSFSSLTFDTHSVIRADTSIGSALSSRHSSCE